MRAGHLLALVLVLAGAVIAGSTDAAFATPRAAFLPGEQCKLTTPTLREVSLGFNWPANRVASLGTTHATVLLVDFAEAPSAASSRGLELATVAGVQRFAAAASYGRFALTSSVSDRWIRLRTLPR